MKDLKSPEAQLSPLINKAGTSAGRGRRRGILLVVRLVVSLGLCIWIITHVDWPAVGVRLQQCNYMLLAIVALGPLVSLWLSAYKWQQLLAIHGIHYSLWQLQRWYLVAVFLNQCLPTIIGGDVYRTYKTLNNPSGRAAAVLAVFAERVSGLAALLILGLLAVIAKALMGAEQLEAAAVCAGILGAGFLLCGAAWKWNLLPRLIASSRWPAPAAALLTRLRDYREHPREVAIASILSFVFHCHRAAFTWLLILAFGAFSNPLDVIITLAAINLVGLLPISIGGFGLVDATFIVMMGHFGLTHETALSTMIMLRVILIPLYLLGGTSYFLGDKKVLNVHQVRQTVCMN